jgi:hypothetical protein
MTIDATAGSNILADCAFRETFFGVPFNTVYDFEDVPICQDIGAPLGVPLPDVRFGVWYKLTVDEACEVDITFTTCDTQTPIDTAIAVYEATTPFDCSVAVPDLNTTLQCIDAADDTCGDGSVLTNLPLTGLEVDGTKTVYVMVYSGNDVDDFDLIFGVGQFTIGGTVRGTPQGQCGGGKCIV